jgi:hypothetical protein
MVLRNLGATGYLRFALPEDFVQVIINFGYFQFIHCNYFPLVQVRHDFSSDLMKANIAFPLRKSGSAGRMHVCDDGEGEGAMDSI